MAIKLYRIIDIGKGVMTITSANLELVSQPSESSFDPSADQTIIGDWEFVGGTLSVEDGTTTSHAVNKGQLDSAISAAVIGVGTGATPISTTFVGGETTWNTGVTITDSHQLTIGSGTGVQTLLHRGVDYTWAGSTFTFTGSTLPITAGEVAFYYPNVAVPATYAASEVAVAPAVNGNTDAQSVLEDHETRIDALEVGGTPTGLTSFVLSYHSDAASNITLTNQIETVNFLNNNNKNIKLVDLTNVTKVRLIIRVSAASASVNNPRVLLRYNSTGILSITLGDYLNLGTSDTEVSCSLSATGFVDSGWIDIETLAITSATNLAAMMIGGDGVEDPSLMHFDVYFKN